MASAILWPFAVVLIWAAIFGITVLLVRLTTHGQQAIAREEYEAEAKATQAEVSAPPAAIAPPASAKSEPPSRTPQPIGPPVPSA